MESRARIQRRQDTKEKKRHKSVNLTRTPNYSQQKSFPERRELSLVARVGWGNRKRTARHETLVELRYVHQPGLPSRERKENWERRTNTTAFSENGCGMGAHKARLTWYQNKKPRIVFPEKSRERNHFSFQRRGWAPRKLSGFSTETCYLLSAIFEVIKWGATVGRSSSFVCARFFIDLNDPIEVSQPYAVFRKLHPGDFAVFNADSVFRSLWSAFLSKISPKSQE